MKSIEQIKNKKRGFTIVELLVVIVVIGILASITIVSYSGVTSRANTASAQSAASSVYKKASIYFTEVATSVYPDHLSVLLNAASTETYKVTGVAYDSMGATDVNTWPPASPATPTVKNSVIYVTCGVRTSGTADAPEDHSEMITVTGIKVYYWNYSGNAITDTPYTAGTISGTVGTPAQNVGCVPAGS